MAWLLPRVLYLRPVQSSTVPINRSLCIEIAASTTEQDSMRLISALCVVLGAVSPAHGNAIRALARRSQPDAACFRRASPTATPTDLAKPLQASHTKGDMTYYDLGLGSCGLDDSGKDDTDSIVALSHLQMGEQSNDNPFCGRTISIRMGNKITEATVRDKCMGCATEDIDVSKAVFNDLVGSLDAGRVRVEWWFN
ncbi:allergen Asp F7 [Verticillium dahliae]